MFDLLRPFYFVRDLISFFRFLQTGMAEVRDGRRTGLVVDVWTLFFKAVLNKTQKPVVATPPAGPQEYNEEVSVL